MKVLRWIFGFPLATLVAGAFFYLAITYSQIIGYSTEIYVLMQFFRLAIVVFGFGTWVFLTCLFIPNYKKLAGLFPVALVFIFILYVIYDMLRRHRLDFSPGSMAAFSSLVIGTLSGYFVSYIIFRNKGWGRRKKTRGFMLFEGEPF
ncbi:MAG TPA: hypothetical protein VHB54_02510 [Mucilaginibacter sp.]|nr:hypothetical protein [Mucilaginibacter sp.]